jgi:hypothetical protein
MGQLSLFEVPGPQEPQLWATPQARDYRSGRASDAVYDKNSRPLNEQVLWPTPRGGEQGVGMCGGTGHYQMMEGLRDQGEITQEELEQMTAGSGGQLNPDWVEMLMGWPQGWTTLDKKARDWYYAEMVRIAKEAGKKAPTKARADVRKSPLDKRTMEQFLKAWPPGWDDGVPRTVKRMSNRRVRLMCTGNGVVPQQIYVMVAEMIRCL